MSGQMDLGVLVPFVPQRVDHVQPFADLVRAGRACRLWQGQSLGLETFQTFSAAAAMGPFAAGTGVTLMPMRHPYEAAVQARSLAVATGRPVLAGFGPGARSFQRALLGAPYASPLTAAREYMTVVRGLLDDGVVTVEGDYFHVEALLPRVAAPRVDIGLGVLRAGMARLAGEVADAAITWLTPASYVGDVVAAGTAEGAEAVNRPQPRLVAIVPVALDQPGRRPQDVVLGSCAAHLALPHYVSMLTRSGIAVGGIDAAADAHALIDGGAFLLGTPDEIAEQLAAFSAAGVDEVVLNTTGVARTLGARQALEDVEAVLDAWATRSAMPSPTDLPEHADMERRQEMTIMHQDTTRLRERLLAWGTARPARSRAAGAPGSAIVVVEDEMHLDSLLASDAVDADTIVLAPAAHRDQRVATYRGSLTEPGDEAAVDEWVFLQTLEYRSCAYVSVLAPTFARITDPGDLAAFLQDADEARATGRVPQFLLEPSVLLADACAFGAPTTGAGPRDRLVVRADGSVSTSPRGLSLGTVGDPLAELVAAFDDANATGAPPCAVALAGVIPHEERVAALRDRPWLGRYVVGIDVVKELTARGGTGVRMSGFGGRLGDAAAALDGADDHSPVLLLWSDDGAYVADMASRRTIRVSRRVGELAELLLVAGGVEAASGAGAASIADLARVDEALRAAGLVLAAPALERA